ncbi:MAG TPA: capsid cement protein [Gemmatimonadaceae bacterium]|nr:capsid cement protein [Gemmatimonadaceae bacterium]
MTPTQGNGANQPQGYLAVPGLPVQVESGAAFASGATLQSDSTGRAITWASGPKLARALEAASAAGQIKWVVFLSGR